MRRPIPNRNATSQTRLVKLAFWAAYGPRKASRTAKWENSVNAAAVDGVDEQTEAAEAAAVEAKYQPRQMCNFRLVPLQGQRLPLLKPTVGQEINKLLVDCI